MLFQKRRNVRKGDRMGFIRGLPEIFEYDEYAVRESHVVLQSNLRRKEMLHNMNYPPLL